MENDFAPPEESTRGIVLGAVILAILVAGVAWYFFVLREPSLPAAHEGTVTEAPADQTAGFNGFADSLTEAQAEQEAATARQGRVNGGAAIDVRTSAETGPAENALALAIGAAVIGLLGLRRSVKAPRF